MPQWYLDEPYISRADEFYMSAFWELCVGEPIPWSDRIIYAERKGLDSDLVDVFSAIIKELSDEYQAHKIAQIEKDTKNNGRI